MTPGADRSTGMTAYKTEDDDDDVMRFNGRTQLPLCPE